MARSSWLGWAVASVMMTGMGTAPPALRIESQQVPRNIQDIRVPLTLKASGVAALQAELRYDPEQLHFREAVASDGVKRAEKQLTANGEHPGVIRLLLFGFNQHTLPEGAIAAIVFERREAKAGTAPIAITTLSATNAKGQAIALKPLDGTVTLH